eukprot:718964-Rhodomonas_salina.1
MAQVLTCSDDCDVLFRCPDDCGWGLQAVIGSVLALIEGSMPQNLFANVFQLVSIISMVVSLRSVRVDDGSEERVEGA